MEYVSPWQDGFTLEPLLFWLCWPINSLVFHSFPCPSIDFGAPSVSLAFVFLLYLVFSLITCPREWAWPVLPSPETCNTNNPQACGRHWPFIHIFSGPWWSCSSGSGLSPGCLSDHLTLQMPFLPCRTGSLSALWAHSSILQDRSYLAGMSVSGFLTARFSWEPFC